MTATAMTTGPDFVSFQVRDRAVSTQFYEEVVGMKRIPVPNEHASAFSDGTATFAVRDPLPGVDLDSHELLGNGVSIWFRNPDAAELYARMTARDVPIVQELFIGPFGVQFAFRDPDGYIVTVHSEG